MCISPWITNPMYGGMDMDSKVFWQVFLDTGAPEMYLLYNKARQTEELHVFNDPGSGTAGDPL